MQPLSLTIPGEFWDSQLYWGKLYLFERSGYLRVIDWDGFVTYLSREPISTLPLECGFRRSNYLYSPEVQLLFRDPGFQELTRSRFDGLATSSIVVDQEYVDRWTVAMEKNRFPFPHSDTCIYWGQLYVASGQGVHAARLGRHQEDVLDWSTGGGKRKWDGLALRLSASYRTLAVAGGTDGLIQIDLSHEESGLDEFVPGDDTVDRSRNTDCVRCDWLYGSIYCSSYTNSGGLFDYEFEVDPKTEERWRRFEKFLTEESLFGGAGFSWGVHNRICQASDEGLKILRYLPYSKRDDVRTMGYVDVKESFGRVIDGTISVFGTIIEYDDALLVLATDGGSFVYRGTPVNWRVFPRSVFYSNQLHITYDDHLALLSFNHDIFVDQSAKLMGIRPMPERRRGPSFAYS